MKTHLAYRFCYGQITSFVAVLFDKSGSNEVVVATTVRAVGEVARLISVVSVNSQNLCSVPRLTMTLEPCTLYVAPVMFDRSTDTRRENLASVAVTWTFSALSGPALFTSIVHSMVLVVPSYNPATSISTLV